MEYTNLGNTHLKISRLCLGTMNFGVKTEEKEAFRIMDMALDLGINLFDTANNYGVAIQKEGITEELIGKWLSQDKTRRDRIILTTKVYEFMRDPADGPNNEPGLSRYKIRRHFEQSLRRLQTDHIEIYFMHHYDRQMDMREAAETFLWLARQGKIDYMGTSNFPAWAVSELCTMARYEHLLPPVCEQHKYNLKCRLPEMELIPAVREHGIGLLAYSPLGNGLLKKQTGGSHADPAVEKFTSLCKELGEDPSDVAMAWVLSNPSVTAAITGPSTSGQMRGIIRSLELELPTDFAAELEQIFPGPGEAPESYSW